MEMTTQRVRTWKHSSGSLGAWHLWKQTESRGHEPETPFERVQTTSHKHKDPTRSTQQSQQQAWLWSHLGSIWCSNQTGDSKWARPVQLIICTEPWSQHGPCSSKRIVSSSYLLMFSSLSIVQVACLSFYLERIKVIWCLAMGLTSIRK